MVACECSLLSSIKVLAYMQVHCLVVLCTWYQSSSSSSSSSISSLCQALGNREFGLAIIVRVLSR